MLKEYTCIMCPKGCDIEVVVEGTQIGGITGNDCPKGKDYVIGELTHPMRNLATSVLVTGGEEPLASVRLNRPIPKESLMAAKEVIQKQALNAPVEVGQIVIENILGLGADVIATRAVRRML